MLGEAAAREEGVREARGLVRAWAGAHLRVRRAMLSANPEPTHALGSRKGECGDRAWELCARGEEGGGGGGLSRVGRGGWGASAAKKRRSISSKVVSRRAPAEGVDERGALPRRCVRRATGLPPPTAFVAPDVGGCAVGYGHRHGAVTKVVRRRIACRECRCTPAWRSRINGSVSYSM